MKYLTTVAGNLDVFFSKKLDGAMTHFLDLNSRKADSSDLGLVRYHGSLEGERILSQYLLKYSFPSRAVSLLKKHPGTIIETSPRIRRHSLNDVVFLGNQLRSKTDVDKLLTRAVIRAFRQKLEHKGIHVTRCNHRRIDNVFDRWIARF